MTELKLFAPGPVQVPEILLLEMAKPNDTHRSKSYQKLHSELRSNLQKLLHTKNDVLLWTCSGSGVMEACVVNLIDQRKDRKDNNVLYLTNGNFGNRWVEMAKKNERSHHIDVFEKEWGKAITVDDVREFLKLENKKYNVVFITMNESSTGVMNPVKDLVHLIKHEFENPDAIIVVDAVSCMAGVDIKVDKWEIDVCLASTQKCFGVPPGLAVSSISQRTIDYSATIPGRGWYFDFVQMSEMSKKNYTPSTPNINCMRTLNKALDIIFQETLEKRFKKHLDLTMIIRSWAKSNGFELFSQKGYASPTITVIKNTCGIDVEITIEKMIKKGYRFANGYGKLKEKTFRIAAMGWHNKENLSKFLSILTDTLK